MNDDRKMPRAVAEGTLLKGVLDVPCAVLDDGRRVLTARGMQGILGARKRGDLGPYLARLQPYLASGVVPASVEFVTLDGQVAHAYDAQALVDICKAYLRARREGKLHPKQQHLADKAEIIIEALAGVGVVALVDEATGYQKNRDDAYLQRLLALSVRKAAEGFAAWQTAWPESLDRAICKLYDWPFDGGVRLPQFASVRLKIYKIL